MVLVPPLDQWKELKLPRQIGRFLLFCLLSRACNDLEIEIKTT